MTIAFHRCNTGVTNEEVILHEQIHAYQISIKGSGTATIEVWPHEQPDDEDHAKNVSIGWAPVEEGDAVDLSGGVAIPILISGANDKVRITSASAFDYSITGVK